jgi:hypothetical protein
MSSAAQVKTQNIGDDLRLPCFMGNVDALLQSVDSFRNVTIPFQSKHVPALKRNMWFALKRPADRSRSGLLCVWKEQKCCVYLPSDNKRKPILLRLRVDPQFFAAGLTVFVATMSSKSRRLWIEDALLWKGRNVFEEESFTSRMGLVSQWIGHYCIADARLIGGLEMEAAAWTSLSAVTPDGIWEFQQDEVNRRPLLWIPNHRSIEPAAAVIEHIPAEEGGDGGAVIAIGTKGAGPDQWNLTSSDGVSYGMALIRKLSISTALRALTTNVVRLEVGWVAGFNKWEVRSLSTDHASRSDYFEKSK